MIKQLQKAIICLSVICVTVFGFTSLAQATFNQNLIMDDATFDNTASMGNISQINSFLNQFPSSCISQNNGFTSPDPVGYSPSVGFTYGANVSGGQVIYDAALAYGINPQVLIATAQKESSVVTGTASYGCEYINTAMGYACPDSGSCPTDPATESGFSKQIIHAAWLLRFAQQRSEGNTGWDVQLSNAPQSGDSWDNSDDPISCYYGPMTQGTLSSGCGQAATYYDGYTTIDGTSVFMGSGATAALYDYTPHFSGNENFVTIFNEWFGSTIASGVNLGRDAGSPVALSPNQSGALQIVGVTDNDSVYTTNQTTPSTDSWSAWTQLPGALRNITAGTNADGRIEVVGVAGNGNIYYSSETAANSTSWSAWTQLNGGLSTAAIASNSNGTLQIIGVAPNGAIYTTNQTTPSTDSWSAWTQLPGALRNITAGTNADGRIEVVGVAGNGNIYYSSETAANSTSWSAWTQLNGGLSTAAIASNSNGTLQIIGVAPNGAIYTTNQTTPSTDSWSAWTQLPGALRNITAGTNADGRIEVVGVAGNGNIYYSSETAANSTSWSAWTQLPGALRQY